MTAAQTAAEMILRAAGTSLKNYTWGETREKIFSAAQAVLDEAMQQAREQALEEAAHDLETYHAQLMSDGSIEWHTNGNKVSETGMKAKILHAARIRALKNKGA